VTKKEVSPNREASSVSSPRGLARTIDRSVGAVVWSALVVSAACIGAIIIIGSWDTVGRMVNAPLLGGIEMTESLLATTIFLALPFAQRQYRHVIVDILYQNLPRRLHSMAHFLGLLVTCAAFAFMFQQSLEGAIHAYGVGEVSSGALRVPVWLAKFTAAAGLLIAGIETFRQIVFVLFWPDYERGRRRDLIEADGDALEHM